MTLLTESDLGYWLPLTTADLADVRLLDGIRAVSAVANQHLEWSLECAKLNDTEAAAYRREIALALAKLVSLAVVCMPFEDDVKRLLATKVREAKAEKTAADAKETKDKERRRHFAQRRAAERAIVNNNPPQGL
jgi:hypothetical protein